MAGRYDEDPRTVAGSQLWPPPVWHPGDLVEAVRRAIGVLAPEVEVTGVTVFADCPGRETPRVHVSVTSPDQVRAMAPVPGHPDDMPPFADHPTDPVWVARVDGVRVFLAVDPAVDPASGAGV